MNQHKATLVDFTASYKYLGILTDDSLTSKAHIDLLRKLKLKLFFFLCEFKARKRLVAATFLPRIDYGDVI